MALAADKNTWVDLYLAALEDAGLLRPEGDEPPIREHAPIVSLMATLASGVLFGPAGEEVRSDNDILGFFEKLRTLYGNNDNQLADIEYWDARQSDRYEGEVPVPALPDFGSYDLGLSQQTHFEAFRIYVPWVPFEDRGAGLPADFQINGPAAVGGDAFSALDFSTYLNGESTTSDLASLTGPQTVDTEGWLPADEPLPYTVNFVNDPASSTYVNEIHVVTQLDPNLDPRSFQLGDIKIGDINIDIPDGRWMYQGDFDFTQTRGFILRVSAGVDLYQDPAAASWVIQAIDPLTGEVLKDPSRGLLKPNDAQGNGAGFVSYTVQAKDDLPTGREVSAEARVLFDTQQPADTETISQTVDGTAPDTTLTAERIGDSNNYTVAWSSKDDAFGSGFRHVTIYVATNGGDFRIWQRHLTDASGSMVFEGEAGDTYEFLALATDIAGNREQPAADVNAVADDSGINLGALPQVPGTTPANFGIPPAPTPTPATNPLFAAAEEDIPTSVLSTRVSEFDEVLHPFGAQAFATGIGESFADIGPMAIVEEPGGTFLISGGPNRGSLWRVGADGGAVGDPLITLDEPIFNLAYDNDGRLWATTGGGPLLELDPATGNVINSYGDGVTIAIAVSPLNGDIYVSTASGVEIFDPGTGNFRQFSRDLNLRVGGLAFAPDGTLWATTWPDREQVVRFTERGRAEIMLRFDAPVDSLAFGQSGTALEDLLFVSHNSGPVDDTGAVTAGADLTMVDIATLRQVAVATGGSRGDVVITTSDGRVLISQSSQVDVLNPVYAPSVIGTNPPEDVVVPLPLPFISVTFDQDMYVGDGSSSASVLNPDNYVLAGDGAGMLTVQSINYDAANRTVVLGFGVMPSDSYTLTVKDSLTSVFGQRLAADYVTSFGAFSDLSAYLEVSFELTRYDRSTGAVSYDVKVKNIGGRTLQLPLVLALDPQQGYAGLPVDADGRADDGRWLIDLADSLPEDQKLAPGEETSGHTVSVVTIDRQPLEFTTNVVGSAGANAAPVITSTPPEADAVIGTPFAYAVTATDGDNDPLVYTLFSGPDGMTIDAGTGEITWTPPQDSAADVPVLVQVFDPLGASALQRFVITVADGNRAPQIIGLPDLITATEGQTIETTIAASDPDGDDLTVWADNLPPGATFDPAKRLFSWTPDFDSAGSYPDIRFIVSDGLTETVTTLPILVSEGQRPLSLTAPETRTVSEGDRLVLRLDGGGDETTPLRFLALDGTLPYGATLNPSTGVVEWVPGYTQAGEYKIDWGLTDGDSLVTATTMLTVLPANGAPVFDSLTGWQAYENQTLVIRPFAYDPDNPAFIPPDRLEDGSLQYYETDPTVTLRIVGDLPEGATFDTDTWELHWRPTFDQAGVYAITVEATDDGDGVGAPIVVTQDFDITILNLNQSPVVDAIAPVTVARDQVVDIPVSASDPEGNPLTLTAENEQPGFPLPDFITFTDHGDGTGVLHVAPGVGDRGDYAVTVVVRDNGDGTGIIGEDSYTFAIAVTSDNEPPVIGPVGDVVAVPGETMSVTVPVSDLDQDELTYEIDGLPESATIASTVYGKGVITWTPTASDIGTHTVTVTVTDTGNGGTVDPVSTTATFNVVVRAANNAPLIAPLAARSIGEGETLTFDLQAVDLDDDPLTFRASELPDGARLDPATGTFTWTPRLDQAGDYAITFTASDGNKSSSEVLALTVTNTNRAPVFVPMLKQLGREGTDLQFTVVASDPDNDATILTLASVLPAGASFAADSGVFAWKPGYDQAGQHTVTFAAHDANGAVSTLDVVIDIANIDRAPQLATSDHTFLLGEEASFTVEASDPDAESVLTYTAVDMPDGATLDAESGLFTWTPGPGQEGDYYVTFQASDGEMQDRQTVVLRAALQRAAPAVRVELTPSFPAVPGQKVLIHPVADSLADITSLTLYVNGSEVALDENGRATVTPQAPGKITVRAVATDADGLTGEDTVEIKVRDPADRIAPEVSLDGLFAGIRFGQPTDIHGSVVDSNIDTWRLELTRVSSGETTLLAEGDAAAPAGSKLGTLDPRTLVNGFYTLRLTATDIGGRRSQTEVAVEVNSADKLGSYTAAVTDLSVELGGIAYDLVRRFDSLAGEGSGRGGLGPGWSFAGFDVAIETNVPRNGREDLGIYNPYGEGTRLFLTLPTGERTAFSFTPVAETIELPGENGGTGGAITVWHPAWTADNANGWTLASTDVTLTKSGTHFYETATGLGYNPSGPNGDTKDFRLTAPDGTAYIIDAERGISEIRFPGGERLFVGDNGLIALSGETLRFLRNGDGAVERVVAPDNSTIVYGYDANGRLVSVRHLSDGSGERYGYADGRLVTAVEVGGAGTAIEYGGDGTVTPRPIDGDLGGLADFSGHPVEGEIAGGGNDIYVFSLRDSELASTATGKVLVRVALTGAGLDAPEINGVAASSIEQAGNTQVAIFSLDTAGLYQVRVTGEAVYSLGLSAAGDVDVDGDVDGTDSALLAEAGNGTDITGDGSVDFNDRQALNANYGLTRNQAPEAAAELPALMTHQDLPVLIDLAEVATDADGDRLYYRVVSSENGVATLSDRAGFITFTPDDAFTGTAHFIVIADDGFNNSQPIDLSVTVSDAPLVSLDFTQRHLVFDVAGMSATVGVVGDFADQDDVPLPLWYVNATIDDPAIATLTPEGLVTALAEGHTILHAERGNAAAGTVVGVGTTDSTEDFLTALYGLDAYPDTVTIVPDGGSRQIVTSIGPNYDHFVGKASDGTRYFVGNSAVVTVSEDGLIEAVGPGETTVTVIDAFGEDTITVKVAEPTTGPLVAVGEDGGIVRNAEGTEVAFGPGQLNDNAVVSIDQVAEGELALPMPSAFDFVAAFDLGISGAEVSGPLQIATPVSADVAAPGDQVFFFVKMNLPVGENGAYQDVWTVVDSGSVDENGVARSHSPPFPGLSQRGNVLVAKANQPTGLLYVDLELQAAIQGLFILSMGIAVVGGPAGAIAGLELATGAALLAVAPYLYQLGTIRVWREWANKEIDSIDIQVDASNTTAATKEIFPDLPPPPPSVVGQPVLPEIKSVDTNIGADGDVTLTIHGANFADANANATGIGHDVVNARVVFSVLDKDFVVDRNSDEWVSADGNGVDGSITVHAPAGVLLSAANIIVERAADGAEAAPSGSWPDGTQAISSGSFTVKNKGGFGFVGGRDGNGLSIDVLDIARINETTDANGDNVPDDNNNDGQPDIVPDTFLKRIYLPEGVNNILDILTAPDLSAVYIATNIGVSVIDGLTLQLFDFGTDGDSHDYTLDVPGGIQALALAPGGRYLYGAGYGKIHVIDLDPASPKYLKIADTMGGFDAPMGGIIYDLETNSDGTRLFAVVPGTTVPSSTSWAERIWGQTGQVVIFNVNEADKPDNRNIQNANKWREVIGTVDVDKSPRTIIKTPTADAMLLTAIGDRRNGLKRIDIKSDDPNSFSATVTNVNATVDPAKRGQGGLVRNAGTAAVRIIPGTTGYVRASQQTFDLDIYNASGIVMLPDASYAFVADWYVPRLLLTQDYESALAFEDLFEEGSKIGIIKDPLGNAQLLASTHPIPGQYLEDLAIDASGKKLFAYFRGAGTVAVYDIEAMIDVAKNNQKELGSRPLDDVAQDLGTPINLTPVDVDQMMRYIAVQNIAVLKLIDPVGEVDIHSDAVADKPLVFTWKVDSDLFGQSSYESQFYLSALENSDGLWPDDPARPRPAFSDDLPIPDGQDQNPNRIFTTPETFYLQSGKAYKITVNLDNGKREIALDTGADAPKPDPMQTIVTLDPRVKELLTAGNTFYWGVRLKDTEERTQAAFRAKPVETAGQYSSVTILTHGFQFAVDLLNSTDDSYFDQPIDFVNMAQLIAAAGGGGTVLWYDKRNGQWVDRDTGAVGAAALHDGKPVVLLSGWVSESDISDSGYAEAAADALFASIMDLDEQTGGKLLHSPLHFIGHSRGAVVNSEIIQRLGTYRPDVNTIQMTTLDPHDFKQATLDLPLKDIVSIFKKLSALSAGITAVAALASGNPVSAAAGLSAAAQELAWSSAAVKIIDWATRLGIKIDTVQYADFQDPDVKVWDNVQYADNYYQAVARVDPPSNILTTVSSVVLPSLFTFTQDGRSLGDATNIDLRLDGKLDGLQRSGFTQDDFTVGPIGFGVGGADDRVLQWYAGTIDTSLMEFGNSAIYREAGDQGIRVEAMQLPTTEKYGPVGWYFTSPAFTTSAELKRLWVQGILFTPGKDGIIGEGVAQGWYYSPQGGGQDVIPGTGGGSKVPVTTDNTEVTPETITVTVIGADGLPTTTEQKVAVPTIYNGDFEAGTKQSLLGILKGVAAGVIAGNLNISPEKKAFLQTISPALVNSSGRFPLSYDLPGWSYHGGSGYTINGFSVDLGVAEVDWSSLDVTGLFTFQTDPGAIVKGVIDDLWNIIATKVTGNLVKAAQNKYLADHNIAPIPTDSSSQGYKDWWNARWGAEDNPLLLDRSGPFAKALGDATALYNTVEGVINKLIQTALGAIPTPYDKPPKPDPITGLPGSPTPVTLADFIKVGDDGAVNPVGVAALKTYIGKVLDYFIDQWNGKKSDYALLMGGPQILGDLFTSILPLPDVMTSMTDTLLDALGNFDSITHNRFYVPETGSDYLTFQIFAPLLFTSASKLHITFNDADTGAELFATDKALDPSFFSAKNYSVALPSSLRGKMVTMTIKEEAMQNDDFGFSFVPDDPALAADIDLALNAMSASSGLSLESLQELVSNQGVDPVTAISQLFFIDDIRLSTSPAPGSEGLHVDGGATAGTGTSITLDQAEALADVARGIWADSGVVDPVQAGGLSYIDVSVEDLGGDVLAVYDNGTIRIDDDAGGHGWFVDSTPGVSEEFGPGDDGWLYQATAGSDAAGKIDLLTVITHEMGHALGLTDAAASEQPVHLMTGVISEGERRMPSAADIPPPAPVVSDTTDPVPTPVVLNLSGSGTTGTASAPTAPQAIVLGVSNHDVVNGDFATPAGSGWTTVGTVTFDGSAENALIEEDLAAMSGLSQHFVLDNTQTRIKFTLSDIALGHESGNPPDAFEVALLDATTDRSILGAIPGVPGSDALLNIQADGRIYFADGVSVSVGGSDIASGSTLASLAAPINVVVSLSTAAPGEHALSFDLIGLGAEDSHARVDDVLFGTNNTAPVATGDTATGDEDVPLEIDVTANDNDADGDPLKPVLVAGPQHGTAAPNQAGNIVYTPEANYNGPDSFTYHASDRFTDSGDVTVTVSVTAVDDAPVINDVTIPAVDEGALMSFTVSSTDVDDANNSATFALVSGPGGATIVNNTGAGAGTATISWTAIDGPATVDFVVSAKDPHDVASQKTFTVTVNDVAPTVTVTGATTATAGTPYQAQLDLADPGDDTALEWVVDWGDGTVETIPADTTDPSHLAPSHTYAAAGNRTVTFQVRNEDGLFDVASSLALTVKPAPVVGAAAQVTGNTSDPTLVTLTFNKPIDPATLVLPGGSGAATVHLVKDGSTEVAGTLSLSSDGKTLSFTPAASLDPGSYQVTLSGSTSGAGVKGTNGMVIDGDQDGHEGGDYVLTFTVTRQVTTPVVVDDTVTVEENTTATIAILANDQDANQAGFAPMVVVGPSNGVLAIGSDGIAVYTPNSGYVGTDTFKYVVSDGSIVSNQATVHIEVVARATSSAQAAALAAAAAGGTEAEGSSSSPPVEPGAFADYLIPASFNAGGEGFSVAGGDLLGTSWLTVAALAGSSSGVTIVPAAGAGLCGLELRFASGAVTVSAPAVVASGDAFKLKVEPNTGSDAKVLGWRVEWGDDTVMSDKHAAHDTAAEHAYKDPGAYRIKVIVETSEGSFEIYLLVTVEKTGSFVVETLTPTEDGFTVRFSREFAVDGDAAGDTSAAVRLSRALSGMVDGKIVVDADHRGFAFHHGGKLSAGDYDVLLKSGWAGFRDLGGCFLDGNRDGKGGDDYDGSFTIEDLKKALMEPLGGGPVHTAEAGPADGLPVTLTSDGTLRDASFRVSFDPRMLKIADVLRGAGLPEGVSLTFASMDAGRDATRASGIVRLSSSAPLPEGTLEAFRLGAQVVAGAPTGGDTGLSIALDKPTAADAAPQHAAGGFAIPLRIHVGDRAVAERQVTPNGLVPVTLDVAPAGSGPARFSAHYDPAVLDLAGVRMADGGTARPSVRATGDGHATIALPGGIGGRLTLEFHVRADAAPAPSEIAIAGKGVAPAAQQPPPPPVAGVAEPAGGGSGRIVMAAAALTAVAAPVAAAAGAQRTASWKRRLLSGRFGGNVNRDNGLRVRAPSRHDDAGTTQ